MNDTIQIRVMIASSALPSAFCKVTAVWYAMVWYCGCEAVEIQFIPWNDTTALNINSARQTEVFSFSLTGLFQR